MTFSNGFFVRLKQLRMVTNSKSFGMHKGIRRSHKFGSSLEFSDFRVYEPGDDVRQIDWNVYGRTNRHYIKRYLDEQEIKVAIYLDSTSSMRSLPTKWKTAKQLASALSFITLSSEDRLTFVPIATGTTTSIKRKGSVYAKATVFEIMNLDFPDHTLFFSDQLSQKLTKGNQINVIITDGLEPIHDYQTLFRKMASLKSNVVFIQLLSAQELSPSIQGDAKLIDSETQSEINISMSQKVVTEYKKRLSVHNQGLEKACHEWGMQYVLVDDEQSIDDIILKDFVQRGLLVR